MLKPRRAKFYNFQVLTGALHTVYHESSLFFKNVPGTFFQRDTSSEAVVIAIVEADPLAKIVSVFLSSTLYTLGTYEPENYIIRGIHPYLVSLYCIESSLWIRILTIKQM